jgi:hypothetical protein
MHKDLAAPTVCIMSYCTVIRPATLQSLISLLFGNLTQDLINFTVAIQNLNPNDPLSSTRSNDAAKKFRNVAAKDASFLIYIGP